MKFGLFSIVAGSEACDAKCDYCISKMTPTDGLRMEEPGVNWRNFRKAAQYARGNGVATAMITGKGEPTLFPDQIKQYLDVLEAAGFPIVELQTNGLKLATPAYQQHLNDWYDAGLTTIALSVVHYDPERNREIYTPHKENYIDLSKLIDHLHEIGFSVRLSVTMVRGYIDDQESLERLIGFAKEERVEQVTVRPVNKPLQSRNPEVTEWVDDHEVDSKSLEAISEYLEKEGTRLYSLPHGATVYDVEGQNVCLTNSLTRNPNAEEIRQLIFFPDGHLKYDWQHEGAVLL